MLGFLGFGVSALGVRVFGFRVLDHQCIGLRGLASASLLGFRFWRLGLGFFAETS